MGKYGVENVPDWNLERLIERVYPRKIAWIEEQLEEIYRDYPSLKDYPSGRVLFLQEKLARLKDKLGACIEERERREGKEGGISVGSPTAYFIDWVYDSDLNDGLTPETAWKTIPQYTTNTIRTPGDVAYVRRGQTHIYDTANIVFDEDGEPNNPITLMGDDGTGWPDETGLDKPIVSFNASTYQMLFGADEYWKLVDLVVKQSSGWSQVDISASVVEFGRCEFTEGLSFNGCVIASWSSVIFRACEFYDNARIGLYFRWSGAARIENCRFDRGTVYLQDIGLNIEDQGTISIINSNFSQVEPMPTDIRVRGRGAVVLLRNVKLGGGTPINFLTGIAGASGSFCGAEDYNGVKLDNRAWLFPGTITRDTAVTRPGGADTSARMEPNEYCGPLCPLKLCLFTQELARWCTAGSRSCRVYVMCSGWTELPTADELYLEVLYYDTAEAKRSSVRSTQAVPANDVWTELSVEFDLYSDSPCYANVILKKYEDGAKVYVDILPIWG